MLNVISIQGRLARDPSAKEMNGSQVCQIPIACDRFVKGQRITEWFDCVAFNNNATFIANHFKKGDLMIVTGRLTQRKYTTQQGIERTVFEILVNNVEFCGGSANKQETGEEDPFG